MAASGQIIEKQGWVWKKSPAGLKGFRRWQKRWFVIGSKAISYYAKPKDPKPLGVIPLLQIVDCEYLPDRRVGCRFDIRVKTLRVYALHGAFVEDAKAWTAAVKRAVKRAHQDTDVGLGGVAKSGIAQKLSALQLLYAKARFAGGIGTKVIPEESEGKIFVAMKEHFPTDGHVLKWLLDNTMHPDPEKGVFVWDTRSDKELAEQDEKGSDGASPGAPGSDPGASPPSPIAGGGSESEQCRVITCKNNVFYNSKGQQLRLCCAHLNDMNYTRGKNAQPTLNDHLIAMLRSPDFLRNLLKVFEKPNRTTHGLAVRLLWTLFRGIYDRKEAENQFKAYTIIHCCDTRFTPDISIAMLNLILTEPERIHANVELTVAFYMPVINKSVWAALFGCMKESSFETRKTTLEDINTILHDNFDNCTSLCASKNWQEQIFSLFTDIPKTKAADPTIKTVFAYCINVLTLVHFQYFMKSRDFYQILSSTLYALHQFGGSNLEGQQVGTVLLSALSSKLASQRKQFSHTSFKNMEWVNLKQLTKICRRYIFKTAFWNMPVSPENMDGMESADPSQDLYGSGMGLADSSSAAQRRMMIERRNAERQKASLYVLQKNRVGKDQPSFYDEADIRDFGFHWNDEGECSDVGLIKKLMAMFRAVGVDKFMPELQNNHQREDRDFLQTAEREYLFWEDALSFCEFVSRKDIEDRKILTYRKVSFLVQAFLAAGYSKSERKAILKDVQKILEKRGVPAGWQPS
jgi:hypothetical protein